MFTRAYKYELRPNNVQRTNLVKHAGVARFAWNWGLAERKKRYRTKQGKERYTTAIQQHKELNALKKTVFPWMYEVSKCAPQEVLRDLEQAYKNFIRGKRSSLKIGFPKFKKKGRCADSFRLTGAIRVFPKEKKIRLPRLGKIRLKEVPQLPDGTRILSATVKRESTNHWFVSLTVETAPPQFPPDQHTNPSVGVDVGVNQFAVLSNGTIFLYSRPLKYLLCKYSKLAKSFSRKRRDSANWRKAKTKLAKLHYRIRNIRKDQLHKVTSYLAQNYGQITIEDLHVKGLVRNKFLARSLVDVSFGTFRQLLEYKCKLNSVSLIHAYRFYPSSKRCSGCGFMHPNLKQGDRQFICPMCGLFIDRDQNASINLENYLSVAVSSPETINACGATNKTTRGTSLTSHPVMVAGTEKQELPHRETKEYSNTIDVSL